MTEIVKTLYVCQKCSEYFNIDGYCPRCGHDKRNIYLDISDKVTLRESINLKKDRPGNKRSLVDTWIGWFPSGDKDKHPEGIEKFQKVDRENNIYIKKVIDSKTGEVVKNVKKLLSDHK